MSKIILSFDCQVHVQTLSEITRDQAATLIYGQMDDENIAYFEDPISGIVNIKYPLMNPDVLEVKGISSVGELLWDIAQAYVRIYNEEAETTKEKILEGDEREFVINRNTTDGIHGIYAHDLGDLFFEGVNVMDDGTIELHVGS